MNSEFNENNDVIIDLDENKKENIDNNNNNEKVKESNINMKEIKNSIYETLGIKNANKPFICFLHLIFKILSIFNYIFGSLLLNNMSLFIIIILFSVFDFWIVKNISGRLLVNLRWWKILNENDEEEWYFERLEENESVNKIDKNLFWFSQIAIFLFWCMIIFLKLISFNLFWATLGIISLFLTGINLLGYYKCSKEAKNQTNKLKDQMKILSFIPKFLKN